MTTACVRSARHNDTTLQDEDQLNITLTSASSKGSSTSDSGVEVGKHSTLILDLICTAHDGTNPTLDVTIETSEDNGDADAWATLGTFTQQTTADATVRKSFGGARAYVRATWTIGGTSTPHFTFAITGKAR